MKIKIDLAPQDVDCLRKHLPPKSSASAVLDKQKHLQKPRGVSMGDEWYTFTVEQAHELLATAERNCSGAVFAIKQAMQRAACRSLKDRLPV